MIPLCKQFKKIHGFNVINNLKTNLGCNYYANQLNYKKIGNLVFCYLVINTQNYTNNSTEDFYVEMPFKFADNWLFTPIKATPKAKGYFIRASKGTNKLNLTNDENGNLIQVKDVGIGYIIYAQFFAFIEND